MLEKKRAYLLRVHYLGGFAEDFPYPDSWYRDIKVGSKTTLEEMSSIILSVLNWDDHEHLFAFTVNDRIYAWLGSNSFVVDERMFKNPFYSAAIPIKELALQEENTFTYEYDFGDAHRLLLKVLQLEQLKDTSNLPLLVSQQGDPPPQYPLSTESHVLQRIWGRLNKTTGSRISKMAAEGLQHCPSNSILLSGSSFRERWKVRFVIGTDKKVLDQWRRSKDKRKWEKAVTILENWNSSPEIIAEKIERPVTTVRKWIQTFNCYGIEGLSEPRKKREEVKRKKRAEIRLNRLLEILHQPPSNFGVNRSNWSLKSIVEVYLKKYGESISTSTASRSIKAAGYKIRKAKNVLTSRDPEYCEKVELLLHTLKNLSEDEMFYFIDELGPLQVKKYGGRVFTPKGITRTVPQNPTPKGSITLSGALSATTNQMTWIYSPAKDTQAMIDLIEILFDQEFAKKRLFVTWDAASWHSSKDLIAWMDDFNATTRQTDSGPIIELVPLPKGSQFLNVIEAVFSGMKRAVVHHSDYQSPKDMKTAISQHFLDRNIYFKENPKRAGGKIWEVDFFSNHEKIRSGNYRDW